MWISGHYIAYDTYHSLAIASSSLAFISSSLAFVSKWPFSWWVTECKWLTFVDWAPRTTNIWNIWWEINSRICQGRVALEFNMRWLMGQDRWYTSQVRQNSSSRTAVGWLCIFGRGSEWLGCTPPLYDLYFTSSLFYLCIIAHFISAPTSYYYLT